MKKILIPEAMRKAVESALDHLDPEEFMFYPGLEAALRWLSENPIVPTDAQTKKIREAFFAQNDVNELIKFTLIEWQKHMFIAPEPNEEDHAAQKIVSILEEHMAELGLTEEEKNAKTKQLVQFVQDLKKKEQSVVPDEIQDLWDSSPTPDTKRRIIEAYRRGVEIGKSA